MPQKTSPSKHPVADQLDVHLAVFLEVLLKAGYAETTHYNKWRLITPFIRWLRESGIATGDVDEASLEAFLACPTRRRDGHQTTLRQFIEHLRLAGAIPQRSRAPSPADRLLQQYIDYLREKQGLSHHSITVYSPFVRTFIVAQRLPQDAAALDALAVRRHLLDHSLSRSVSFTRLLAAALRSFLRFCFAEGVTARDFSTAMLPVHKWQQASVPAFLSAKGPRMDFSIEFR